MTMLLLAIPLTLGTYRVAGRLHARWPLPVLNPVLVTMLALIALFLATGWDYHVYQRGTMPLTWLLEPAVVALAVLLYLQLANVKRSFMAIAVSCLLGVGTSLILGTELAALAGGSSQLAASLAPKAVTTPVAMSVAEAIGGIPAITAASVIVAGILGASFGSAFLRRLGVTHDEAVGLAMGASSHALGTARCAEENATRGAFGSLALVICAVLTSCAAPFVVPLLLGAR